MNRGKQLLLASLVVILALSISSAIGRQKLVDLVENQRTAISTLASIVKYQQEYISFLEEQLRTPAPDAPDRDRAIADITECLERHQYFADNPSAIPYPWKSLEWAVAYEQRWVENYKNILNVLTEGGN